ncbi:hypothetical protein BKA66DRAFT_591348 [Pyrenochaeta sp. MPI-SDFR-AT-0127]|nr:hypothetical protein BKA66DRAFT_591348 [Pyrenochaeta sp. MPI-SDFR-AT-0127]
MSFYIYYGKLESNLFVVVLPNGTVEHGDPIHLYTKKKLSSYKAKDVTVNDDGEDLFAFNDGYYSYKAVSKKGYRELSLTVKSGEGINSQVALTRHYDQPITAIPLSDPPKIWTGAIDFHNWAKNESFIVVAPKGLGNGKPVVSLWQWTEDSKGVPRTLSYSTGKQQSEAASPATFSFKQGDYYTLNCKANAATSGLAVAIKGPTNSEVVQKELVLSAKVELGAEHSFAPPRPAQQQLTLDCSLPRASPSLPRITGALPFPADLVETLTYSAAFVDQAGYLAKYAVKQFDQLDKSYHQLEKKYEARGAKLAKLEAEVTRLGQENQILKGQNADLEKKIIEEREAAEKRNAALEKKLREALEALDASQKWEKKLEAYIDADKLADIERERQHREHDAADHKAIDLANKLLNESREAERELQKTLEKKNKIIADLEASLKITRGQLGDAEALIRRLRAELAVEKAQREELQGKLDEEIYNHDAAKKEVADLQKANKTKDDNITKLKAEISRQKDTIKETEDALRQAQKERDIKAKELEDLEKSSEVDIKDLQEQLKKAKDHDRGHHVKEPKSTVTEITA